MLSVQQVGEIRVADDSDFRKLKALSDDNEHWKQEYHKNLTTVWTKNNEVSSFKILKVTVNHLIIMLQTFIWPRIQRSVCLFLCDNVCKF